jgi:hypothetical protein
MGKFLSPERIFRVAVIGCLLGMGAAMIAVAQHPQSYWPSLQRNKDLASYFLMSMFLFGFFYVQYLGLPRFIKRSLNKSIGYVQSVGGFVLLLYGAVRIWHPWIDIDPEMAESVFLEKFWWSMALVGEAVFVLNIIWTYAYGEDVSILQPAPVEINKHYWVTATQGWPKSPLKQFGITAAFFFVGGVLSLIFNFPATRLPIPMFGQTQYMPFSFLWFSSAVTFGLFAFGYRIFLDFCGGDFDVRATRIHFVLTLVAVWDSIRVTLSWQTFGPFLLLPAYIRHDTLEVSAFIVVAVVAFAVNIFVSRRRAISRSGVTIA